MAFGESGGALFFWQLEDSVVELLPKLDAADSNLVDGFIKLQVDSEDTASLLGVSALPFSIGDAFRSDNHILDK